MRVTQHLLCGGFGWLGMLGVCYSDCLPAPPTIPNKKGTVHLGYIPFLPNIPHSSQNRPKSQLPKKQLCDSPPSTPTTMIYWVSPEKLLDTLQYSTPAMENLNLILCFSRLCPKGRKKQSQSAKWVWLKIPFKQPFESCLIARRMIDQWMFKPFSEFSSGPKVRNLKKKQGQYDPLVRLRSNPMFHWLKRPERRWSSPHTVPSPQSPAHRCPAADVALQMFPFHQPRWIIKPSIIHGAIMKYIYIYIINLI